MASDLKPNHPSSLEAVEAKTVRKLVGQLADVIWSLALDGKPESDCTEWEDRIASQILALRGGDDGLREAADLWGWLAQQHGLELDFGGEDDECAWRIHRCNGGVNDREWTLIATGDTPLDAVIKARAALHPGSVK